MVFTARAEDVGIDAKRPQGLEHVFKAACGAPASTVAHGPGLVQGDQGDTCGAGGDGLAEVFVEGGKIHTMRIV